MRFRLNARWFVWVLLALCLAALPIGLINRKLVSDDSYGQVLDPDLTTSFTDRIQVIHLSGMLMDKRENAIFGNSESAPAVLRFLRQASEDMHVKGILLRINSPGGTVSTSQEIANQLINLRNKKKIVVVSMADVAASGGYYIACAADKVVAEPGTITGSIGVIFNTINLKGLGDKLGIEPEVIKSGQFKDLGSPFRKFTAEDKAILQTLILDSYDQFVEAVAKGRNMPLAVVKKLADGRIYSGRQALVLGLIDHLGGYNEAMDILQGLCQKQFLRKTRLPVEEVFRESIFSGLMDLSRKSFRFAFNLQGETPLVEKFMPEFISADFYHMPLWIMQ